MEKKVFIGALTLVIAGLFVTSATGTCLSTLMKSEEMKSEMPMELAPPMAPIQSEPIHIHNHPNDMNKGIGKIHANQPGGVVQQFTTTSSNTGQLYYKFFWGDGTNTSWLGPYTAGQVANATHDYNAIGIFNVTAICKADNVESGVSDPTTVRMYLLGDTRGNNFLDFGDIGPFVMILSAGKNTYYNNFPSGYYYTADCGLDGLVNFGDINPFVYLFQ